MSSHIILPLNRIIQEKILSHTYVRLALAHKLYLAQHGSNIGLACFGSSEYEKPIYVFLFFFL